MEHAPNRDVAALRRHREPGHVVSGEILPPLDSGSARIVRLSEREVRRRRSSHDRPLRSMWARVASRSRTYDLGERLAPLCRALAETRLRSGGVRLTLRAEPARLPASHCWRVGLIIGRLVDDIARTGFDDRGGDILVEVATHGGAVCCCISTDGDLAGAGLGGLIPALVADLDGRLEWRAAERGAAIVLVFPRSLNR